MWPKFVNRLFLLPVCMQLVCAPAVYANTSADSELKKRQFQSALNQSAELLLGLIAEEAGQKAKALLASPNQLLETVLAANLDKSTVFAISNNTEYIRSLKLKQSGTELSFSDGKETYIVSLAHLAQQKLVINNKEVDLSAADSPAKLLRALETALAYGPGPLSNLVIPEARAAIGVLGIVVIAVIASLAVDFWSFLDNLSNIKQKKEEFKKLEKQMLSTIDQCESDLDDVRSMRNSIVSNQTTQFMEYLKFHEYEVAKPGAPQLLSCDNLKKMDGVLTRSPIFRMDLFSKVKEMCALGGRLDACLQETERELNSRNATTYDTRDNKDEFPSDSAYRGFIQTFGSGAKQD